MKPKHLQPLLSVAILCATASAAFAQVSFSENFNSITAGTNLQQSPGSANWYASASSFVVESGTGLSASNSIATASTTDRTAIWKNTSFDFAAGAITASVYFNVTSSGGSIQLSLFPANNSNTNRASVVINTITTGNGNASFASVLNGSTTSGTGSSLSLGTGLTAGSWYFFTATFTPNGTNLDLTGSLFNSSSAGVVGSQIGSSYSFSLANPAVLTDTTIYGGFRSSFAGKTDEISFSQIPEPASFAALAGLGALGLVATRRRRSAA